MADNGANVSCAICYIRNKRCTPLCEFAQYFPPETVNDFESANELYGTRRIVKMMRNTPDGEKHLWARSLLREGATWIQDPTRGCFGTLRNQMWQIRLRQEYLYHLRAKIHNEKERTQLMTL